MYCFYGINNIMFVTLIIQYYVSSSVSVSNVL